MSDVEETSVQEAHARIGDYFLLDVREPHELDGPLGHVAGARLVPLGALDRDAGTLPADRVILAVCRSGRRSARACEILAAHGRRAINLAGGMIAWNQAGLPIERRAPATPAALRDALAAWFAQLGGIDAATARAAIDAALSEAGASWEAPSAAGLGRAIDRCEAALSQDARPADLDLSLAFFRESLAVL
jgi:rhodanese-related sulfurtransferase